MIDLYKNITNSAIPKWYDKAIIEIKEQPLIHTEKQLNILQKLNTRTFVDVLRLQTIPKLIFTNIRPKSQR